MYPFSTQEQFSHDQWYVVAWSHEVSRALTARRILDIPMVLYRTEAGAPVAMQDMCPHRRFPLSRGKLIGDKVQCQYHGFTFDQGGACTRIPAQERVPATYKVRTYPLVEKWEWIWAWMGDPALADPAKIPDHRIVRVEGEGWKPVAGGLETLKARYALVHENLLDLSHLSFLHENTIGSAGVASTEMNVEEKPDHLEIARYIRSDSVEKLPLAKALGMTGLVDRTMIQQFFPPNLHVTGSAFSSAADGGNEPGREFGSFRVIHGITPESATTTHYFWGFSRDFLRDDDAMTDRLKGPIYAALLEDVEASELIEAGLADTSNPKDDIHCRGDAAALRGRLMIERLIAAETATQAVVAAE